MNKMMKWSTAIAIALSLGQLVPASAGSLSPELLKRARAGDRKPVGVIVRFSVANTPDGRMLYKDLRLQLKSHLSRLGSSAGFIKQAAKNKQVEQLWLSQSIYLPMSPVQARALARLPFVDAVFENFKVKIPKVAALSSAAAPAGVPTHLQQIGAPAAWAAGFKGQGIRIGHLDSGIDASHPELAGKVMAFAEFDGKGNIINRKARDTTNHGTHTAGLLVGKSVGVAPDAKVISALVLPNDQGTFAQVIAGMQYVLDPDNNSSTDDGAHVVNMSLGIPGTYKEFLVPLNNMLKAGVVPVFAVGNFGPNPATTGSPGNLPDAIAVGAVGNNGQVASFSSRGPVVWQGTLSGTYTKPDIAAPGVKITSAYPGGKYGALSGSSQASPIAAGAAALLLSAKKSSVDSIKNALYTTASNAGSKNNNVGHGLISVPKALGKLGVNVTKPPAPTPKPPAPTPKPPAPTPKPPAPTPKPPAPTPKPPAPTPKPPAPTPPNTGTPAAPAGFTFCVWEGGVCKGAKNKEAAFGTAENHITGTSSLDTFPCSVAEWGGYDPAPNQRKACFIKGKPASKPTPTPAKPPAPSKPPTPSSSGKKPSVLLVDGDMGEGADVRAALRNEVIKYARSGATFLWDVERMGQVPLSELRKADIVIWATGEQYQNTITAADQQVLTQYLKGGGKLILTGQDVGYDIGDSNFYGSMLASKLIADSSETTRFTTSGAFGHGTFTLNAAGSAQNQVYPDVIGAKGRAKVVASWDNKGNKFGSIVANDAGTYRTVNMGFGLEGLSPQQRDTLVKTAFAWLMR